MTEEIMTTNQETAIAGAPTAVLAFDTSTREGKVRLFNALNSALSLNDANLQQLTIRGIIIRDDERVDPVTGESVRCKFTTFITDDGAYYSQSDGIAESAENFIHAFGDSIADVETTIEFYSIKLAGGRALKKFRVVN